MPLGKYKTWDECIAAQSGKGFSRDIARKICGKIESNIRKAQKKNHGKK